MGADILFYNQLIYAQFSPIIPLNILTGDLLIDRL